MKIRNEIEKDLVEEVTALAKAQGLSRNEVTSDLYTLYVESNGNPRGFDVLPELEALNDSMANLYLELHALKVNQEQMMRLVGQLMREVRDLEGSRAASA